MTSPYRSPHSIRVTLPVLLIVGGLFASAIVNPSAADPTARSEASTKPAPSTYPPTARYEVRRVEGWPVVVSLDLLENEPELAKQTLTLLQSQLYQVGRRVPPKALEQLRKIRIWVEEREPNTLCMAYHPDAGWLKAHGVNPDKAHCVELANARNFLTWTIDQPWMVLHELAHGYHHQFLEQGFDNPELKAAFEQAKAARLYESVLRINGKDDRAYATTNPMEYFAEASEAFFGTNDFYPYVRSELQRHDPKMFALLETLWGGRDNAHRR